MGMASGENDIYFGTDVGQWGAKGARIFFLACQRGKFFVFTQCVYTQNAATFVQTSNMGEKHETNFNPVARPPSRPLAAGLSMCHSSLVTRGGGRGAGVGGTVINIPVWDREYLSFSLEGCGCIDNALLSGSPTLCLLF